MFISMIVWQEKKNQGDEGGDFTNKNENVYINNNKNNKTQISQIYKHYHVHSEYFNNFILQLIFKPF